MRGKGIASCADVPTIAPVSATPRYAFFLALKLDASLADRIPGIVEELGLKYDFSGKLRPAHVWHVTLQDLGEEDNISEQVLEAVAAACEELARIAYAFKVTFSSANSDVVKTRPGEPQSLVLAGDQDQVLELQRFNRALGKRLKSHRVSAKQENRPHITLLYGSPDLQEPIEPVSWTVSEFVLIRSHLGLTKHETLGRWTLRPGPKDSCHGSQPSPPLPPPEQIEFGWD